MADKATEEDLKMEVITVRAMEESLKEQEEALMKVPQFAQFLKDQKEINARIAEFWKDIEARMIHNGIKNVKGEWGSVTIAERIDFDIDEAELPKKFMKKVVDKKKLADTYKLEGKPIKGASVKYTQYLTKRLK